MTKIDRQPKAKKQPAKPKSPTLADCRRIAKGLGLKIATGIWETDGCAWLGAETMGRIDNSAVLYVCHPSESTNLRALHAALVALGSGK